MDGDGAGLGTESLMGTGLRDSRSRRMNNTEESE